MVADFKDIQGSNADESCEIKRSVGMRRGFSFVILSVLQPKDI